MFLSFQDRVMESFPPIQLLWPQYTRETDEGQEKRRLCGGEEKSWETKVFPDDAGK
jgi:hypothetical protein